MRMKAPSPSLGVPEHALTAWRALHERITATGPTPCTGADADRWNGTTAEQRWAAGRCIDCPALIQCGTYADTAGERHGVWGGTPRTGATR